MAPVNEIEIHVRDDVIRAATASAVSGAHTSLETQNGYTTITCSMTDVYECVVVTEIGCSRPSTHAAT